MKIKRITKTQIQPTPIVTGEKAKLIEKFLKIKPSVETEKGKQMLEDMFGENGNLKPCPFCGSKYVFVRTTHRQDGVLNTQYEVYCSHCSACGGSRIEESTARKDWNKRYKI